MKKRESLGSAQLINFRSRLYSSYCNVPTYDSYSRTYGSLGSVLFESLHTQIKNHLQNYLSNNKYF